MFLGRETLENHSQLPKKANKCSVGAVASFSYVRGGIGMSASSIHRESTDSLILFKAPVLPIGAADNTVKQTPICAIAFIVL